MRRQPTRGDGTDDTGAPRRRRALVVTVVHHPHDARILHRQIGALLAAGWQVAYAAPWTARDVTPPATVRALDLPRATMRDRLPALLAARRLLARHGPGADIIILHDPELLLAAAGLRLPVTVWDVHEDTAAALADKRWLPAWAVPPLRRVVALLERWAERRYRLLLAEEGYRPRFKEQHLVVPNFPITLDDPPPPGDDRVVYVGRISFGRGVAEMVALARRLHPEVRVDLIGYVEPEALDLVQAGQRDGVLEWHGYVPNDQALLLVAGATAGLSLLHDEPNNSNSLQSKVVEYLAAGVPVITTPLPPARALVEAHRCGIVVPFEDVDAVERAVRRLRADAPERERMGARGRAAALDGRQWQSVAPQFVARVAAWADGA